MAYDPNDPHQNPAADPLRVSASPETRQAAEANEAAIAVAKGEDNVEPPKETVGQFILDASARLDVVPVLAYADPTLPDAKVVQVAPATTEPAPTATAPATAEPAPTTTSAPAPTAPTTTGATS